MAKKAKTINVMVGCPTDVEGRYLDSVREGITSFNENYGKQNGIVINPKHWKTDTYSSAGNPQDVILEQMDDCEMLIALFYISSGSAEATDKPGTYEEIDAFCKEGKQVFAFFYDGEVSADLGSIPEMADMIRINKKYKNYLYYKTYRDEAGLKKLTEEELTDFYKKKNQSKARRRKKTEPEDPDVNFRNLVYEHLKFIDQWLELDNQFYFKNQSEKLIESMKADGSVSYYTSAPGRYRTTPVATTLQALSAADLLPDAVRYKMQDWLFQSRTDKCDPAGESGSKYEGHPPDDQDISGWSMNEGVSVWTTSKTLESLLCTNYFCRSDLNEKVFRETYEAIDWLTGQQNEDGGWGFQKYDGLEACASCVTMTALTLKVLAVFRNQLDEPGIFKNCEHKLIKKVDDAHGKGARYLESTKIEKQKVICWKYDNKISVTGGVWVLDWLNCCESAVCDLAKIDSKEKIISGILARLPENLNQFEEYTEEIYFKGGKTRYKNIKEYNKFYSYVPYHVKVLMEAGVAATDKRIVNIVSALISGGNGKWKAKESPNATKKSTTYVHAMALSVIALWLKNISFNTYSNLVRSLKRQGSGKQYGSTDWEDLIKDVREEP